METPQLTTASMCPAQVGRYRTLSTWVKEAQYEADRTGLGPRPSDGLSYRYNKNKAYIALRNELRAKGQLKQFRLQQGMDGQWHIDEVENPKSVLLYSIGPVGPGLA